MSYVWSFKPDSPRESSYDAYRPVKKKREGFWVAPEHGRIAASMTKDFPRDARGDPLPNSKKELVVDKRPTIMVPPRPTKRPF